MAAGIAAGAHKEKKQAGALCQPIRSHSLPTLLVPCDTLGATHPILHMRLCSSPADPFDSTCMHTSPRPSDG